MRVLGLSLILNISTSVHEYKLMKEVRIYPLFSLFLAKSL